VDQEAEFIGIITVDDRAEIPGAGHIQEGGNRLAGNAIQLLDRPVVIDERRQLFAAEVFDRSVAEEQIVEWDAIRLLESMVRRMRSFLFRIAVILMPRGCKYLRFRK